MTKMKTLITAATSVFMLLTIGICASAASSVTAEDAKKIALENAGVSADEVMFIKTETENDDGIKAYDIEFCDEKYEYEYEISMSGKILECDKEINDEIPIIKPINQPAKPAANDKTQLISAEAAKTIATKHAGIDSGKVRFTKAKLTRDDGINIYDIEFISGNVEYDYEIDATTGIIIKYDRDIERPFFATLFSFFRNIFRR